LQKAFGRTFYYDGTNSLVAGCPDGVLPTDASKCTLKLGDDLAGPGAEFLATLERLTPGGRCVTVPVPNNLVTLRYLDTVRRCERMSGGVPPWSWPELGPMVRDLDALYVNFISGFEMGLEAALHLFEVASGGTFFLDEIAEISIALQAKLLRVLQENEIRPAGDSKTRKINVRIIAATASLMQVPLATRDADFKKIREIQIIRP